MYVANLDDQVTAATSGRAGKVEYGATFKIGNKKLSLQQYVDNCIKKIDQLKSLGRTDLEIANDVFGDIYCYAALKLYIVEMINKNSYTIDMLRMDQFSKYFFKLLDVCFSKIDNQLKTEAINILNAAEAKCKKYASDIIEIANLLNIFRSTYIQQTAQVEQILPPVSVPVPTPVSINTIAPVIVTETISSTDEGIIKFFVEQVYIAQVTSYAGNSIGIITKQLNLSELSNVYLTVNVPNGNGVTYSYGDKVSDVGKEIYLGKYGPGLANFTIYLNSPFAQMVNAETIFRIVPIVTTTTQAFTAEPIQEKITYPCVYYNINCSHDVVVYLKPLDIAGLVKDPQYIIDNAYIVLAGWLPNNVGDGVGLVFLDRYGNIIYTIMFYSSDFESAPAQVATDSTAQQTKTDTTQQTVQPTQQSRDSGGASQRIDTMSTMPSKSYCGPTMYDAVKCAAATGIVPSYSMALIGPSPTQDCTAIQHTQGLCGLGVLPEIYAFMSKDSVWTNVDNIFIHDIPNTSTKELETVIKKHLGTENVQTDDIVVTEESLVATIVEPSQELVVSVPTMQCPDISFKYDQYWADAMGHSYLCGKAHWIGWSTYISYIYYNNNGQLCEVVLDAAEIDPTYWPEFETMVPGTSDMDDLTDAYTGYPGAAFCES